MFGRFSPIVVLPAMVRTKERGRRICVSIAKKTRKPSSSTERFIKRVTATGPRRMPPSYAGHDKLTDAQIDILRRWIEQGAKYEPHWSFQAPRKSPLPSNRNPVDAFVLAKLEREGLKPSGPASKRTLIRRLTLDLTGLPPTIEETEAFVRDESPAAYEKAVDRLLASPAYAERMAIRWLDAARYADTNGYQTDGPRDMWPWRDWVIDAFHRDMPYDQFTVEQTRRRPAAQCDAAIRRSRPASIATTAPAPKAASSTRSSASSTSPIAPKRQRPYGSGLTVGCARCHDHKFDPISQKEYYSMFAFFNNVPERASFGTSAMKSPSIKAPLPEQQKQLDRVSPGTSTRRRASSIACSPRSRKLRRNGRRSSGATSRPLEWTVTEGQKLHLAARRNAVRRQELPRCRKSGPEVQLPRSVHVRAMGQARKRATGAILSRGDDYAEGQQHGLYLMDGKLRLHVIFRWTDLGMRVETAEPLAHREVAAVVVSYDGGMRASGVRMYVDGKPQELKVLFDQLLWPIDTQGAVARRRRRRRCAFSGAIEDVRVYDRALTAAEEARSLSRTDRSRSPTSRRRIAQRCATGQAAALLSRTICAEEVSKARSDLTALKAQRDGISCHGSERDGDAGQSSKPRDTFLLKRGAYDAPGEKVTPAVPAHLPRVSAGPAAESAGPGASGSSTGRTRSRRAPR